MGLKEGTESGLELIDNEVVEHHVKALHVGDEDRNAGDRVGLLVQLEYQRRLFHED